jgi:hypothetical protein
MDYLTQYYKNLSEQLQEEFDELTNLLEGGGQKYVFGINHTDNGAWKDILKLSETLGYNVERGGNHMKIFDPKTNELVTIVSTGTGSLPGRMKTALNDIQAHQTKIGGLDGRTMDMKDVRKAMSENPRASGLRAIGAAGIAGAGAAVSGALSQSAEASLNALGGMLTPPDPKSRMEVEKGIGSDVGIAYDLSPEGELMGNPAGFAAVHKREKEGRSFPTMFPQDIYK